MVVVRRTRVCVCGEMFVVVFVVRFVSGMRGEGFDSAGRRRELAMFFRHVHAGKERKKGPREPRSCRRQPGFVRQTASCTTATTRSSLDPRRRRLTSLARPFRLPDDADHHVRSAASQQVQRSV